MDRLESTNHEQPSNAAESAWVEFRKYYTGLSGDGKPGRDILPSYDQHPLILPAVNVSQSSIFVVDIQTMHYIYISPNFDDFLGWSMERFIKEGASFTFSQVHPDDVPGVVEFGKLINEFFKSLPDKEKPLFRSYWDYRLKGGDGKYFKIIHRDCALKFSDGKIDELLLIASKIDSFISLEFQHLRLTNGHVDVFHKYDQKAKKVKLLDNLTKREIQIAILISQSKSLKEIASDLCISFSTVKVHSASILKKLMVTNSLEMANILRIWGYI